MLCSDLIKILERYAPPFLAESWDNPGMQTGDFNQDIKSIMIALDASEQVIGQAAEVGADLLITHHPLLFRPVKKITEEDFIGKRIRKLIRNNISLYAMHTNCDIAKMADYSADMLELTDTEPLGDEAKSDNAEKKMGIGKVGRLKEELSFEMLCSKVKKGFNLDYIQASGERDAVIKRVAVCPGAGHDYVEDALRKNAQVLITGDLGYHTVMDARAKGLYLIDAGHFGTEKFMKQQLRDELVQDEGIKGEGIKVWLAKEESPFCVI